MLKHALQTFSLSLPLSLTFDESPACLLKLDIGSDSESGLIVSSTSDTVPTSDIEGITIRNVMVEDLQRFNIM